MGAVGDAGDDAHMPATDRAYQREHLVDAGDQHRPVVMRLALGQSWLGAPTVAKPMAFGLCRRRPTESCGHSHHSGREKSARKKAQSPIRCRIGLCEIGLETRLLLRRRQVRAATVRHLRRHADALNQRGGWVDSQTVVWSHIRRTLGWGGFAVKGVWALGWRARG
jgi:hypothetical protein